MVDFLKKRLQVFVSSTFADLREERQAAVEAILSAGHIPAGMELFAAGDESQLVVIRQWIDESDVYLLIVAGRYGSIETKSGKSYTQLEYEYALSKGKPTFACVLKDGALDARVRARGIEMMDKNQKELDGFRELVKTRVVEFWEDSKDVQNIILRKLGELARREDLVGWVRPSSQADVPALANEVARLSKENAELRTQVLARSEPNLNGLSFSEIKELLQDEGVWDNLLFQIEQYLVGKPASSVSSSANRAEVVALLKLGLAVYSRDSDAYLLTPEGRLFFNRAWIESVRSEQTSSNSSRRRTRRRRKARK